MADLIGQSGSVSLFETEDDIYFEFQPHVSSVKGGVKVSLLPPPRHKIGRQDDLLKKAIGYKKGSSLKVLDMTAGLLRDAMHFVALGCDVTVIEENSLLSIGIARLLKKQDIGSLALIAGDALTVLPTITTKPDVIYYDPMFGDPDRKSGAGKESLLLQELCKPQDGSREAEVLKLARTKVKARVVVKRPKGAEIVGAIKPDFVYTGKAVRYDVYLPNL